VKNPNDSPLESRMRERIATALRARQADLLLRDTDIADAVRSIEFFNRGDRPRPHITASLIGPPLLDEIARIAVAASDEVAREEGLGQ
jgi:hypothetical protein